MGIVFCAVVTHEFYSCDSDYYHLLNQSVKFQANEAPTQRSEVVITSVLCAAQHF